MSGAVVGWKMCRINVASMSRASAVAAARRTEDSTVAFVEHSSLLLLLLILGMCFHSIPIRFEHSLHANLLPCDSPLNEAVSNSQQWRYTVGERERERVHVLEIWLDHSNYGICSDPSSLWLSLSLFTLNQTRSQPAKQQRFAVF